MSTYQQGLLDFVFMLFLKYKLHLCCVCVCEKTEFVLVKFKWVTAMNFLNALDNLGAKVN